MRVVFDIPKGDDVEKLERKFFQGVIKPFEEFMDYVKKFLLQDGRSRGYGYLSQEDLEEGEVAWGSFFGMRLREDEEPRFFVKFFTDGTAEITSYDRKDNEKYAGSGSWKKIFAKLLRIIKQDFGKIEQATDDLKEISCALDTLVVFLDKIKTG